MATLATNEKELRNKANHLAQDAAHSVREMAEDMGSRARGYLSDTSDKIVELRQTTEKTITNNPLSSVALAAVGGLVLGALLRR